ncbi:hypothetical protein [Fusobacterium nucleatum]|nr:hypothetical protein [Fusobacterium nucleatum]
MKIRKATIKDLNEIAGIELACFPPNEAATKETLEGRLQIYSNHFWLLEEGKKVISFVDGMVTDNPNLTDEMYENPNLHNENGK